MDGDDGEPVWTVARGQRSRSTGGPGIGVRDYRCPVGSRDGLLVVPRGPKLVAYGMSDESVDTLSRAERFPRRAMPWQMRGPAG